MLSSSGINTNNRTTTTAANGEKTVFFNGEQIPE